MLICIIAGGDDLGDLVVPDRFLYCKVLIFPLVIN